MMTSRLLSYRFYEKKILLIYIMKKTIFIMIFIPVLLIAGNETDSLKKLLETAPVASKAEILNSLAFAYKGISNNERVKYARQALAIATTLKDTLGMINSFSNIAWGMYDDGDADEALNTYLEIAGLQKKKGDKQGLSSSYNNIGWILYNEENYNESQKYYNLALKLKREVKDRAGEAVTLNNLAGIYHKSGNKSKAMEYLLMAHEIRTALKDSVAMKASLENIKKVYSASESEYNIQKQIEKLLKSSDSSHYQELKTLSDELLNKEKLIADKETDIEDFKSRIDQSAKDLEEKENRIRIQKLNLDTLVNRKLRDSLKILNLLNQDLVKNQRLSNLMLAMQKNSLESKQDSITKLNQKIQIDSLTLIRNKEHLELLKNESEHQAILAENREKLLDNQKILYGSVLALVSSIAVFFIYRFSSRKKFTVSLAQKNIELEIAKEKAELASSYKTEFLANMSHEIRTPMNAILGFSDLLSKRVADPKNQDYVSSIVTSGKSLLTLINDILDLSKIEAGKLELDYEPVDIRNLFDEVKQIFALNIKSKQLAFEMIVDKSVPPTLMLDETRLRQILVNLVGNAIKFTFKGKITITAEPSQIKDRDISLRLSVADTGIGIPKEQQEAIFEAFRQQSGQKNKFYGGTGLGLSITKRLVEMMHGRITIESEIDKGSKFTVHLENIKIADSSTVPFALIPELLAGSAKFSPADILLVDDVETNRRLIKEYLNDTGLVIYEADTGGVAVDTAIKIIPGLIFLDIRLPDMSGFDVAKRIRANPATKDIPIIALTASAMKSDFDRIKETGFDGYLTKPINKNLLLLEIMKYIEYEMPVADKKPGDGKSITITDGSMEPGMSPENLKPALKIIEEEIMEEFNSVVTTQRIGTIKRFAEKISDLSVKYSIPVLNSYADTLKRHTESFDLNNIRSALARFPEIVKELKEKV
jgi:signal transduction histidine kinase/response regulator of citrate/malate metabolism